MRPIEDLLELPDTTIALVGATDNPQKYGSIIYRNLSQRGYCVYPVNPGRQTVAGDRVYPDVGALPVRPTIVCLVLPPEVGLDVVRQCNALQLSNIWLQPGAESPRVLSELQEQHCNFSAGACIMVMGRRRSGDPMTAHKQTQGASSE